MATTTPPLRPIVEPPTPLHGARFDSYEAYEPRRRSSRLKTLRTPSPSGSKLSPRGVTTSSSRITRSSFHNLSPPSSPLSPPESRPRKRAREGASTSQLSDDMANANPKQNNHMLPTPVKTPRKKDGKTAIKSTARVLFPHRLDTVEDPTPVPKKRGRRIGFSLDSPSASSDGKIEIFEDSKDKIPEVDESADNPFYTKPETRSKKGKGKSKSHGLDHNKEIQEILERDEGMIYVFRGKKVYRKFEDDDYDQPPIEEALGGLPAVDDPETPRHFTRSSVKPRFLFPHASKTEAKTGDTTDEEAVTDVEYPQGTECATSKDKDLVTPAKNRFYATPPTTARATRTTAKRISPPSSPPPEVGEEEGSPSTTKRTKKTPFAGWQRSKPGSLAAIGKGRKRDAESPALDEGSKRQKSKA